MRWVFRGIRVVVAGEQLKKVKNVKKKEVLMVCSSDDSG